ncbi:MAG: hypothetical protein KH897_03100 [Bacteroides sp.]|uniref:hypothetical protein n=1 Tax=Bacteroides sp. TaxID=29523 RepID=UPI0025C025FE|nr:hypothetical protein [Bacteroides sp.]MBS6237371.1 hypothetical protein [Bacteroides sp.]
MDEDKKKKPLLSYEQVVEIIDECVSRDETDGRDERIVRIEKAAEELEAECRKKVLRSEKKKRRCSLKWFCMKLFRCTEK